MNPPSKYDVVESTIRNEFAWEWHSGSFRIPIEIILRTFQPFIKTAFYHLTFITKFWQKGEGGYTLSRIRPTIGLVTSYVDSKQPKLIISATGLQPPHSEPDPCPSCGGFGTGGPAKLQEMGVPDDALTIHEPLIQALSTDHFQAMRSKFATVISSVGIFDAVGVYQIVFTGYVLGFGASPQNSIRLIHYPIVWSFPVNMNFDEAVKTGLNPHGGSEAQPNYIWHQRCETCGGSGFVKTTDDEIKK